MNRNATTLKVWLSGLCHDHLDTVLTRRGERARPQTPYELGLLARRLTTRSSVIEALQVLPRPALQLAGALVALGDDVVDAARAARLLGAETGSDREHFALWLSELMDYALVWPAGAQHGSEVVCVNPGLVAQSGALGTPGARAQQRLHSVPTEFLMAIAERWNVQGADRSTLVKALGRRLADPDVIRRRVADAPASAMTFLLDAADEAAGVRRRGTEAPDSEPHLWIEDDACEEIEGRLWAERHGLAFRVGWDVRGGARYRLAAETVVALMSDDVVLPFDPAPPPVALVHLPTHEHTDAARVAVAAVQEDFRRMLTALDVRPAALLRQRRGGVGVRELRRIAREAALDEPTVRLFLEVADDLGLLRWTWDGMMPAPRAEESLRASADDWVADVIRVWPRLTRSLDADHTGRPALVAEYDADALEIREEVFGQVHALPPEHGFEGPADVAAFARWRLPLAFGPVTDQRAESAWWEAARLGILVGGGLTPLAGCTVEATG